jgi:hypothetical protein
MGELENGIGEMKVLPVLPELPEPVDGSLSMAACRWQLVEGRWMNPSEKK